jgi:hypothetical protein
VGPSFSISVGQLTLKVTVSFFRRIAFDHLAADVRRSIRRAYDVRAADFQIDFDHVAEKILLAEFGRRQRLPHLFRRGGDVDRVDDGWFEIVDVRHILSCR